MNEIKTKIKPYYEEENITIYNCDCLEVMKEFPDKYFDLCLTDPPYNVNFPYGEFKDKLMINDFINFYTILNKEIIRSLKDDGLYCLITPQKTFGYFLQTLDFNLYIDNWLIYKPHASGRGITTEFALYNICLIFSKNNNIKRLKRNNVIEYKKFPDSNLGKPHPCPYLLQPIKELINYLSIEDDIVLDPFLGSGTTARACKDLGRKCIGIEISKEYCDIAIKRLGQEVLF